MVKSFMANLIGLKNHPGACVEGIPGRFSGGGKTQMCVEYHAIDWSPRLNKKEKRGARVHFTPRLLCCMRACIHVQH